MNFSPISPDRDRWALFSYLPERLCVLSECRSLVCGLSVSCLLPVDNCFVFLRGGVRPPGSLPATPPHPPPPPSPPPPPPHVQFPLLHHSIPSSRHRQHPHPSKRPPPSSHTSCLLSFLATSFSLQCLKDLFVIHLSLIARRCLFPSSGSPASGAPLWRRTQTQARLQTVCSCRSVYSLVHDGVGIPVPDKPYGFCGRWAPCLLTYWSRDKFWLLTASSSLIIHRGRRHHIALCQSVNSLVALDLESGQRRRLRRRWRW